MKQSKIKFQTLMFISTVCFIIFSCCNEIGREYSSLEFKNALEKKIMEKINNINPVEINIKELTTFEWENFIVISPYSNLKLLEKDLNMNLEMIKKTEIEKRDDINVLVFTKQGVIVKIIVYPRWPGDFSIIGKRTELFTPSNAIFLVEQDKQRSENGENKPWLIIKKK